MASVFKSSIGKKLIMSISGLFLILFLTLHMGINLVSVFSLDAYDAACDFMGTNSIVQLMVPILAMGFVVHIGFAFVLEWQNRKARGTTAYKIGIATKQSWFSKNMLVLGIIVLGILFIHLSHFWAKMQLQEWTGNEAIKGSLLIVETFSKPLNVVLYTVWILALSFHLMHGFWSAFQSMGLTDSKWNRTIKIISHSYVTLLSVGFLTPVIYFFIQSLLS